MRLGVASTPMSCHDCCMTCSIDSRCLLPALVIIVNFNLTPPLARMPSDPLTQPAPSRSDSALALSKLYRTFGLSLYAHEVGGSTEFATEPWPKQIAGTLCWRFRANSSAWRTALSWKILPAAVAGLRL